MDGTKANLDEFKLSNTTAMNGIVDKMAAATTAQMEKLQEMAEDDESNPADSVVLIDLTKAAETFDKNFKTIQEAIDDLAEARQKENEKREAKMNELYTLVGESKLQTFRRGYEENMAKIANQVASLKAEEQKLLERNRSQIRLFNEAASNFDKKMQSLQNFIAKKAAASRKTAEFLSQGGHENETVQMLEFFQDQKQRLEELESELFAADMLQEQVVAKQELQVMVESSVKFAETKTKIVDDHSAAEFEAMEELSELRENVEHLKAAEIAVLPATPGLSHEAVQDASVEGAYQARCVRNAAFGQTTVECSKERQNCDNLCQKLLKTIEQ